MSKQYAWITGSLVSDNDWPGFTPKNYKVRKKLLGLEDNGYTTPYNFVSASDFGSYYQYGSVNARRFGWTKFRVGLATNVAQFIPTDFVGLNTNVTQDTYVQREAIACDRSKLFRATGASRAKRHEAKRNSAVAVARSVQSNTFMRDTFK